MEYREFGKTGFKTSIIGMGTYYDPGWIVTAKLFRAQPNVAKHLEAIKTGLDGGINLIDTAELYGSENIVARAIEGRKREDLFIATKVWRSHLHHDSLIKACKKSLRNLNTNYIDLYQVHFPNGRVPIQETIGAMEYLVDQGLIRHFGISNFSMKQMEEAEDATKKYEITSTQMNYSLAHRNIEKDILPHCIENNIAVLPYFPLAHGKLSGQDRWPAEAADHLMKKHGLREPSTLALAWLTSKWKGIFPIPRASNPRHVKENLNAGAINLDTEDMKVLDDAFPA
ncbi:MAG: aldo/keto reductase [Thermoplasmataceae archaeon]